MTQEITTDELLAVLHAVERGDVTLEVDGATPAQVYAGDVYYKASNGWRLVVFNDCGEWDYLDSVIAPDGRSAEFPDGHSDDEDTDLDRVFWTYRVSDEIAESRYLWDGGGLRRTPPAESSITDDR